MDYLEGLFLGKLWSDTDYENRRHLGLFVLYGLLVDSIVLFNYFIGKSLLWTGRFGVLQIVLLSLLFLACPFICFRYYRMPIAGKIAILFEKVFKSYLIVSMTVGLMMSRITIDKSGFQDYVVNYLNGTLEKYTETFAASAGSFATVLAVLAGGIHVVLTVVLIIATAVVIPGLVYLAVKFLQYGYDWLINKYVIKRFFPSH